jgi:hypothetical protein
MESGKSGKKMVAFTISSAAVFDGGRRVVAIFTAAERLRRR